MENSLHCGNKAYAFSAGVEPQHALAASSLLARVAPAPGLPAARLPQQVGNRRDELSRETTAAARSDEMSPATWLPRRDAGRQRRQRLDWWRPRFPGPSSEDHLGSGLR